jgi:hypothetical protein
LQERRKIALRIQIKLPVKGYQCQLGLSGGIPDKACGL